jgi:hypothetical protein
MRWARCVMGLKSSPHGCVKMHTLAEEVVRGNTDDLNNPFGFDQVLLNLPGDPAYDPRQAKVIKFNTQFNSVAGDMLTYVDDTRVSGSTFDHCWAVCHKIGTTLCYLGIQDALRKRSIPSQLAGAWAGTLTQTPNDAIIISCTQEIWSKARAYVQEIMEKVEQGVPLNFKTLERQRGFLVYVTRTYPSLVPYLKGIHLTLDSWRPGRDQEGCRSSYGQKSTHMLELDEMVKEGVNHPDTVLPVPRLRDDLQGLLTLLQFETPPRRAIRSAGVMLALYGFGDLSGAGFGSTVTSDEGVHYRYGVWGDDPAGESSNYRELFNLTETASEHIQTLRFSHLTQLIQQVEHEAHSSTMTACEFYLFTDNAVALIILQPKGWFVQGHGLSSWARNPDGVHLPVVTSAVGTTFLWAPPPAAASVAIEQLSFSRLKRPHLTHIFICPRLMTHMWRKQLCKVADLVFTLPAGRRPLVWPASMFEPLIIGVILPYLSYPPWSRRSTAAILEVGSQLSSLWSSPQGDEWLVLRQLWDSPGGGG